MHKLTILLIDEYSPRQVPELRLQGPGSAARTTGQAMCGNSKEEKVMKSYLEEMFVLISLTGKQWQQKLEMNSGVFLIRPDREEFLYLLNLKKDRTGATQNDQSWLNDVYKFEKFFIMKSALKS